jgi:hypothetical protein
MKIIPLKEYVLRAYDVAVREGNPWRNDTTWWVLRMELWLWVLLK